MQALPLMAAALLLISGCLEASAEPRADLPDGSADDAKADRPVVNLDATSAVQAPTWKIGDWFGHHVFFGADDNEGEHYNTVVVSETETDWMLATDDAGAAKDEAVFDIPILGPVRRADLQVTGLGATWDLFRFPMKDGTSWTSDFVVDLDEEAQEFKLTHTARFNPAIQTPNGPRPGFDIEARTADGELLLFYDYVPDIGWYAHLFVYDLTSEEADDFLFHVMSMGHGSAWTGTYYIYEAEEKVRIIGGHVIAPEVPPEPMVEPHPYTAFNIDAESTYVYGLIVAVAVAGVQEVVLIDPEGGHHEVRAIGAPEEEDGAMLELPSIGGEWRLVAAGAGLVAIEVAFLYQLTETTGEL